MATTKNKRLELDFQSLAPLRVGQTVKATKKLRGMSVGTIKRFTQFAANRYFADVQFEIPAIKFLKAIRVDDLESFTCRRSKAK